ncbi:tail fiber assembly protein [Dickeya dadantii]|uniref:tail fiber assembly protein n=1 Tax=Dickeya dadantii TaxID=204038 RepID=UPI001CF30DD3|nr:tail fiber assembly protein [Dickeya dadantii]
MTDDTQKQKKSDQILAALLQKVRLLNDATKEITPLQDAVDLEPYRIRISYSLY